MRMIQKTLNAPLLLLVLGLVCSQAAGAQEENTSVEEAPVIPADDFDRGTPRRSADGFMAAVDRGDFETAAEYMDLRNLRGEAVDLTGAQLARRLFVIIGRATWVDVDDLVDDPAGRKNDNLPHYRDSIGVVLDEAKEVRLLMQKVPRGDGVSIWKISNATVSIIPELYELYGYPEIVEDFRRSVPDVNILGYELFKLLIVLATAVSVYIVVFLIALAVRRILADPGTPSHKRIFRFLVLPFGIWVVIISVRTRSPVHSAGASRPKRGASCHRYRS